MVSDDWRTAVEASLRRECGSETCLGREAIAEALSLIPDEPVAWCVETDEKQPGRKRLVLLAVVEGGAVCASAPCERYSEMNGDDEATVDAEVYIVPRLRNHHVTVLITRAKGGPKGESARTTVTRRLGIGSNTNSEIALVSNDDTSPEQVAEFDRVAQALLRAQLREPRT
jgi:hypothetical protein